MIDAEVLETVLGTDPDVTNIGNTDPGAMRSK
jgi:hypothetical protein